MTGVDLQLDVVHVYCKSS